LQVSLCLIELYCAGADCLEVVCKLKLICLGFRSTGSHQLLTQGAVFLDSDGPITFDSRSGVRSSGISMSSVDVFSGGMVAEECSFLRMGVE
jgi:hypothetical protein